MNEQNNIKNLLFDLGGVIMDLSRTRCVEAFKSMGLLVADDLLGLYVQEGPFRGLEEGTITPEQFRNEIRKHIAVPVTDDEIDYAFNQFLLGIPPYRLEALELLRHDYNIYLLSNTNAIMVDSDIKKYFRIGGKEMADYFDGMVLSYEAKSVKPDRKIFEYTIEHLHIKPEETLFFDDSQKNLDAASLLGFHTGLVEPGMEFTDVLTKKTFK